MKSIRSELVSTKVNRTDPILTVNYSRKIIRPDLIIWFEGEEEGFSGSLEVFRKLWRVRQECTENGTWHQCYKTFLPVVYEFLY
jgi:hypothetical protein